MMKESELARVMALWEPGAESNRWSEAASKRSGGAVETGLQTMAGRSKKKAELDVIYLFEKGSARNSNEDSMVLSLRVDHVVKEAKNVEEAADDDKRGGHLLRRAFCAALLTSMRLCQSVVSAFPNMK